MKMILQLLLYLPAIHLAAQEVPQDDYWKHWIADAERTVPKYAELCKIWKKTDQVQHPQLSEQEMGIVRYWLLNQADNDPGGSYRRMAAITAGNTRDRESYETLEKIYLDSGQGGEMVREEAFRAIAKIDPDRAAKFVIKELSSGTPRFAMTARILLEEVYGTSFEAIKENMKKTEKHDLD
jgi:HEAT repeat protein